MTPDLLPPRWRDAIALDENGCWIWQQSLKPEGYGQAHLERNIQAHRAVWKLLVGPIPEGHHLHHLCHVRPCVNPEHLTPMDPTAHQNLHFILDGACSAGHAWTPENTYFRSNGQRQCRRCKADRRNRWYRANATEDIARRTADRRRVRAAP